MWLFVDDNMTLINTDNVESIEVSEKSIYMNMVNDTSHLYGRYADKKEAADALHLLRPLLNSCN